MISISWKAVNSWDNCVEKVLTYYGSKPDLKFGAKMENKGIHVITSLCRLGCATRDHLNQIHKLEPNDDIATILSNVTMAIQKSGEIMAAEDGGWYETVDDPYGYIVCPAFAKAWIDQTSD